MLTQKKRARQNGGQKINDSTAKTFFTPKGTREHEVFSNNCAPKFKILN